MGAHKQAMVTKTSVVILPTFKPCFGVAFSHLRESVERQKGMAKSYFKFFSYSH
jgi:hypothetical protein